MKLSIIIPTYNEEKYLPNLLNSIVKQDYNDYEIIVADADSDDKTVEIAESYGCKVVHGGMPAVGRNKGADIARGEILLFLDSDLRLPQGFLKNCVKEFEDENLGIAIGQMVADSDKKYYQVLHDIANKFMISVENIKPHGAGCYGIVSKHELHNRVGGFDETLDFGEDTDYIEKIGKISNFKVLRHAKLYVSTRRLEEEGLPSLVRVYGKSTINDFIGKRTTAEELGYTFGHDDNHNDNNVHGSGIGRDLNRSDAVDSIVNQSTDDSNDFGGGCSGVEENADNNPNANEIINFNSDISVNDNNLNNSSKQSKDRIIAKTNNTQHIKPNNTKSVNADIKSNNPSDVQYKHLEAKKLQPKHITTKKPVKISTKMVTYRNDMGKSDMLNKNSDNADSNSDYSRDNNQKNQLILGNKVSDSQKVIFYCVCGEGMGHAIRSGVILEYLVKKYNVFIFSGNRAYNYLNSKFDNVYEIGVFNTVYEDNVVNDVETFIECMKENPSNMKKCYNTIFKLARKYKPGLIISDFENYSNIIAKFYNIPLISLDNIHMISETEIDCPPHHKIDMLKAKAVIKVYVQNARIHILTSFFNPPVKKNSNSVIYPPILRNQIFKLKPVKGEHVLVYQTSDSNYKLMRNLKKIDEQFIVYGFNKNEVDENLTYREFNEDIFYDDLRTAKAVITNGGFTLISEAIYLKKPIYSMPALGNFEQIINGFYVDKLGYGEYHEDMKVDNIKKFLLNLDKYQKNLDMVENTDNSGILRELDKDIKRYYRG